MRKKGRGSELELAMNSTAFPVITSAAGGRADSVREKLFYREGVRELEMLGNVVAL